MYLQSFPGLMSLTLGDGTTQRRDDTLRQFVASSASGSLTEVVPYGEDENAAADLRASTAQARANGATLRDRAARALATNRAFLALAQPATNAQALAQVQALTRQNIALIRLVADLLDGAE